MRDTVRFKVCLVGNEAVGKTSLLRRYIMGSFKDTYTPSMGASNSDIHLLFKRDDGSEVEIILMIWDIMGKKDFKLLQESFFKGARAVGVISDFTSIRSLKNIQYWVDRTRSAAGNIPILLVCNKNDAKKKLFGDAELDDVSKVLGMETILTSAKNDENVDMLFSRLGKMIVDTYLDRDLQFVEHLDRGPDSDTNALETRKATSIRDAAPDEKIDSEQPKLFEQELEEYLEQLEGKDLKDIKNAIKRAYLKLKKERNQEDLDFALLSLLMFYYRKLKTREKELDLRERGLEQKAEKLTEEQRQLILKRTKLRPVRLSRGDGEGKGKAEGAKVRWKD